MAKDGLISITTRNIDGVVINNAVFLPVTLTFTAAEAWPAGAVLGRLTASGNYVRYDPTANDGSQVPSAVLTDEVSSSAAGNTPYTVMVQGEVRAQRLVIKDGTVLNDAQRFALRDYSIIARDTFQITEADNS